MAVIPPHNVALPAALAFFHLALAFAAIFARVAALNFFRFLATGFSETLTAVPLILAHRALAPAAMAALPARDMRRFFLMVGASELGTPEAVPPSIESSWLWSVSICCLMAMARWSWTIDKSLICGIRK